MKPVVFSSLDRFIRVCYKKVMLTHARSMLSRVYGRRSGLVRVRESGGGGWKVDGACEK